MLKIIIDANVWIRFSRSKSLLPILNRIQSYNIIVYSNNYLLSEIHKALLKNNWANEKIADALVLFIKNITIYTTETAVYRMSIDHKDNYLFDLAIQNNCSFIISDDLELVSNKFTPIPVYTTNWFLKHFIID